MVGQKDAYPLCSYVCGSRRGRKYRSVAGLGLSGDTGAKALVKRLGK